jgi:hypothetical protein
MAQRHRLERQFTAEEMSASYERVYRTLYASKGRE